MQWEQLQGRSGIRLTIHAASGIFGPVNMDPADFYALLSHQTRLRCLLLLRAFDELCVCELTGAIGAAQPHMSRHLARLREVGLVCDRRQGLWIHYRINPELPAWVVAVLDETALGVSGVQPFALDLDRLAANSDRPGAAHCA